MRKIGETLARTGLSAALALGITACGDNEEPEAGMTREEHFAEADRLDGELAVAREQLADGEAQYIAYVQTIPEDCWEAVQPFIPPAGEFADEYETSSIEAAKITAPWCGPDYIDAVSKLRYDFHALEELQGHIGDLDWWIGANLAKAGLTADMADPTLK